jgi:hypothetical protein
MSRAAILDAIVNDSDLQAEGFDSTNVLVNYDGEQRPSDKMFLVLRWEAEDPVLLGDDEVVRSARNLAVWVHMYREFSTDFVRIDDLIQKLNDVLSNIIDTPGADGYTVSRVEYRGSSRDLRDDGYDTLCRSTSYWMLSRKT